MEEQLINFKYVKNDDKNKIVNDHCQLMLLRALQMFKVEGFPSTINETFFKSLVLSNGFCGIIEYNDKLYALGGDLGGAPDVNYQPTTFTWANPFLQGGGSVNIEDCVIFKNDIFMIGLKPLFEKYASLMCENEITLKLIDIIARFNVLLTADNDNNKTALDNMIKDIYDGKIAPITAELNVLSKTNSVNATPLNNSSIISSITSLIEYQQYLKSGWYADIGLNSNYNMKRESLTNAEISLNDEVLYPLYDHFFEMWTKSADDYNEKYGAKYGAIKVTKNSIWKEREESESKNIE